MRARSKAAFLHEPYRQKLSFMKHKLQLMLAGRNGYRERRTVLERCGACARGASARQIGALADDVEFLCRQIRVFGFHLVALDVRDNSQAVHAAYEAQKSRA